MVGEAAAAAVLDDPRVLEAGPEASVVEVGAADTVFVDVTMVVEVGVALAVIELLRVETAGVVVLVVNNMSVPLLSGLCRMRRLM